MNMIRRLRAVALALPFLVCSGCFSLQEHVNDTLIDARNCSDSWHAWIYYRSSCPDQTWYPHHYGKGFRAGYRDVAAGGDGCPPTLPPSCYWSVCYQSPVGQAKVQEWFHGYVFGANAARIDGVADYNTIMTADRLFGHCTPQSAADVQYMDHGSGWSSDGNHPAPTPATQPPRSYTPLPGAEIPSDPYFPNSVPEDLGPQAAAQQQELLHIMQSSDGPRLR